MFPLEASISVCPRLVMLGQVIADHAPGDPVLHRAERVAELQLGVQLGTVDAMLARVEAEQRGIPDQLGDVASKASGLLLPVPGCRRRRRSRCRCCSTATFAARRCISAPDADRSIWYAGGIDERDDVAGPGDPLDECQVIEDHVAFQAQVAGEEKRRLAGRARRADPPGRAGRRPVDEHRVEHHFLAGRADLVPADVQVDQQAPVGGLLDELDAGQRDARVVDQRLARFQPEFDHVLAQHLGDRPAALAGQRPVEQLAQRLADR